jgi:L-threonate 2-dehydrogenase
LQALIGVSFEGLFEAMVLGERAGVATDVLAGVINDRFIASRLTETTTGHIVARRFRNTGSHIETMHKDLRISLEMARAVGAAMPATAVVGQMFQAGRSAIPDGDNWCLVEMLETMAGAGKDREAA